MLRGDKGLRNRTAVLPTLATNRTAPDSSGHREPATPTRADPEKDGRAKASSPSNGSGPSRSRPSGKPATVAFPEHGKPTIASSNKPAPMAAPLDDPDDTPGSRRWLKSSMIVTALAAAAAAGWLYRSAAEGYGGSAILPRVVDGQDVTQLLQALQREHDNAENLSAELRSQAATMINKSAAQSQELSEVREALQRERDKADKLARELGRTVREPRFQSGTQADDATLNQPPTDERPARRPSAQRTETSATAYQEILALERARTQDLERQLAARQVIAPEHDRDVTLSPSDTAAPTTMQSTDSPAPPLVTDDKPTVPAATMPAPIPERPAVEELPGNSDAPRLMARAGLLLSQGNVGAARIVLDRVAESGSASALFALAETYDPIMLAAWGTVGTQGDAAKARQLYAKALAGGVGEAGDRLNALRD
jgi:hypothetical protein